MSLDMTLVSSSGEHWQNITHNLADMAEVAGLYKVIWRPDEHGIEMAWQLVGPLEDGIADMVKNPWKYIPHNAKNGYGTYKRFLPWLLELLDACRNMPDARIHVDR